MNIYELCPGLDIYQTLLIDKLTPSEQLEILYRLRGEVQEEWHPFDVTLLTKMGRQDLLPSDYPCSGGIPVFNQNSVEALVDILEDNGQLLPLNSRDGNFYAYNTTTLVPALDKERSDLSRNQSGNIIKVSRYSFIYEVICNLTIFKLSCFSQRAWPFVTDRFIDRIREHDLKGFRPNLVWSSED